MFSRSESQLESISDPESPGVLACGGHLGEPEEEEMGVLARHECLRVADIGILFTGVEATGILVHQGRLSAADGRVPHPEASPGLLVRCECVDIEDVPATGDNGELTMSSQDPVGVLVRHMGGFGVDVLGSGLPLCIRLRKERRFCRVCCGDICSSSS